jgi:hypothetical protein
MSYTVSITRNNVPAQNRQAWQYLDGLFEKESGPAASDYILLIDQLREKYPCICDLPDDLVDEGVWSDGPLVNNAGKDITTLGVVYSKGCNSRFRCDGLMG